MGKLSRQHLGFTLLELVMVIVLLGIVSVGVSGVIKLSAQTFMNVSSRDELLSSARFAVERLNREIRDALPNSIRIAENVAGTIECIEFTPIVASTTYIDIPVLPEDASNTLSVLKFFDDTGADYACSGTCTDTVIVYPTNADEVYTQNATIGKAFPIDSPEASVTPDVDDLWTITLDQTVLFDEDSVTNRLYLVNNPVSYCVNSNDELTRYSNYDFTETQAVPPIASDDETTNNTSLMAEDLNNINQGTAAFSFTDATLQRNALVEIELHFLKNDEDIVFNNQIQVRNVP